MPTTAIEEPKADTPESQLEDHTSETRVNEIGGKTNSSHESQDEHDETAAPLLDDNGNPISKKAMKRKLKADKVKEYRRQQKDRKRQKKREQALADGRDVAAEQKILQEQTREGGKGRERREEDWKLQSEGIETRFGICIDCAYQDVMTDKECNSLAQQIRYCYAQNKRSVNPCRYFVSQLSGYTREQLAKEAGFPQDWTRRAFVASELPLLELIKQHGNKSKDQLVYLTADSDTVLTTLNDDHIYVIGGIVDRNRLKRAAFDQAQSLGIQTARLPIDEHVKISATRVLTCVHVLQILLKVREYNHDWKKALLEVLPQRKEIKEK